MESLPENVGGYFPLPLEVAKDSTKAVWHILYVKKHQAGADSETAGRTVFAVNLPLDANIQSIKDMAQSLAGVNIESFSKAATPPNTGYLVFVDKQSCNRFLSRAKAQNYDADTAIVWTPPPISGRALYTMKNEARFPAHAELQAQVDEYMEAFAQAEEDRQREVQEAQEQVDEDGFTLVVGSKRKSLGGMAALRTSQDPIAEQSAKKKRKKEKTDFYRFQIREQKKQEMNSLLRRFQDDKRKVEELRQKRRFNPY